MADLPLPPLPRGWSASDLLLSHQRVLLMPTGGSFGLVEIDQIDLDTSNPRIAHFLEMYDPPYKAETLHMALQTGGDDDDRAGSSFTKLKQSIITNRGIVQPIILEQLPEGRYRCIEGNTRVFLYREFREKNVDGSWGKIPSIIHSDVDETDVHAIRLQAHLVGPRPWDPYSKAKYLHHLRNKEHFAFSQLVDLCGGNTRTIKELLGAYEDMEDYYRPVVGDEGFEQRKFSGFVELQRPNVKSAIAKAGYSLVDFAEWIRDDKIEKLADVRSIPLVMKDEKARKVFVAEGMTAALKVLDRPQLNKALEEADLAALARALRQKIDSLPFSEVEKLKDDPSLPALRYLVEARDRLQSFVTSLDIE